MSMETMMEKQKPMMMISKEEEESDSKSSRDSNTTHTSSSSSDSPPHKRPRLLLDHESLQELEKIKSGDPEVVHLKDYVDWFMSLGDEVDENDIFLPEYYGKWFSTLGDEAKAGRLQPYFYTEWYVERYDKGEPTVFPTPAELIEILGALALEYFNEINKCGDYIYVRDVAIRECEHWYHLNFYGCLKGSPSMPEPESPEILFFAEVMFDDTVSECCILDSENFGDARILHPPGFYCAICNDGCGPNVQSTCPE